MTKKLLFFTFLYKLSYSLFANESPSLKKSLIPPQSPSQDFTMKTSGVVQYHFDFYVSFTLAFPILLNQDVLQKAIALVQNDLPEFGARLILDKKLRGPALHFVGSDGIQFEFRSIDDQDLSGPLKNLRIPGLPNSPEMRPVDWRKIEAIQRHRKPPQTDTPLVFLKLTHLKAQNVSILDICINHALGDTATYAMFLQALSYHAGVVAEEKKDSLTKPVAFPVILSELAEISASGIPRARVRATSTEDLLKIKPEETIQPPSSEVLPVPSQELIYDAMTFNISAKGAALLKKEIIKYLEHPTEQRWVSTYEVIIATAIAGIRLAQGPRVDPLSLQIVVNLRARMSLIKSPYYIGNAVDGLKIEIYNPSAVKLNTESEKIEWLAKTSWNLHEKIRSFINDPSEKPKCVALQRLEQEQSEGNISSALKSLKQYFASYKDPLILNSWAKYPCF